MNYQRGFISSRLLLVVVLGVVIIGGVAYYIVNQPITSEPTTDTQDLSSLPTTNTQTQQLEPKTAIAEETVIEASLKGKYEKLSRPEFDDGYGPIACDTFVVYDGDPAVVEYFISMVRAGNTVHTLTSEGHLRINLPWNDMPEFAKQKLLTGEITTVHLIKKEQVGRDGGPCYSFFAFEGIDL